MQASKYENLMVEKAVFTTLAKVPRLYIAWSFQIPIANAMNLLSGLNCFHNNGTR